jgi:hypothetical protein
MLLGAGVPTPYPLERTRRGQDSLDEHSGGFRTPRTPRYFVLPVTVKWARLFFCQQSSVEAVQTGTSLP